jgi:hypothetical protein
MMIKKIFTDESERIEYASERADLFMQGIQFAEMTFEGEDVYVGDENGDIRYSDWAQDLFNQRYDDEMAATYEYADSLRHARIEAAGIATAHFDDDELCRNGKPINQCSCC